MIRHRMKIWHRMNAADLLLGLGVLTLVYSSTGVGRAEGQTGPGGPPVTRCPADAPTIGSTFFEVRRVDLHDLDTARLVAPSVIDISPSGGYILIGDREDYDVKLFDRDGRLLNVISARGEQPGQVFFLDGAAFRSDSSIVVVDGGRMQLMEFGLDGDLIAETYLPVRPITSVQVVGETVLVGGRSPPTLTDPRVRGVHALDSAGNIAQSLGPQPLASVGAVPRYLVATVPFVARSDPDSIVVAWRLTNRLEAIDLRSGEARTFPIGGGLGYVDPDTLLDRLAPEERADVLNLSSPIVGLFVVADHIVVAYFSPATGSDSLRYLIYERSGTFVELVDDPPLVLGTHADSLLAIGRPSSLDDDTRYAIRIFSACVTN